jgi:hypothetical protein
MEPMLPYALVPSHHPAMRAQVAFGSRDTFEGVTSPQSQPPDACSSLPNARSPMSSGMAL